MPQDFAAYNMEYQKENIVRKIVKFNKKNPDDVSMLAWLSRQNNFSAYCKRLIRADIQAGGSEQKPNE